MKVLHCSSSSITIDLGEEFDKAVVVASGEIMPQSEKFRIFSGTIKQIKPIEKELTKDEQQKIVKAISKWNSQLKTLLFD